MNDSMHNAVLKTLALLLGAKGLVDLIEGLDRAGFWGKLSSIVWGVLVISVAVGFFRMRGWAFLLASVGLLGSFFATLIGMLVAIDRGEGVKSHAFWFVATLVLIAYLGRWSMERRFRPHLEQH